IAMMERGRIHGIEQLRQFGYPKLDLVNRRMAFFHGRFAPRSAFTVFTPKSILTWKNGRASKRPGRFRSEPAAALGSYEVTPVNAHKCHDKPEEKELRNYKIDSEKRLGLGYVQRKMLGYLRRRKREERVAHASSDEERQRCQPQRKAGQAVGNEKVIGWKRAERVNQEGAEGQGAMALDPGFDDVDVATHGVAHEALPNDDARHLCQHQTAAGGGQGSNQRHRKQIDQGIAEADP